MDLTKQLLNDGYSSNGGFAFVSWQYLTGYLKDSELKSLFKFLWFLLKPAGTISFVENRPTGDSEEKEVDDS